MLAITAKSRIHDGLVGRLRERQGGSECCERKASAGCLYRAVPPFKTSNDIVSFDHERTGRDARPFQERQPA